MKEITVKEFNFFKQELEKDPNNLDLINTIAIGYFENYDQKSDKEDFDYFEKAYLLKRTVKSTHNFAWFLYFEWSEIEWRWKEDSAINKAIRIQKECIALKPKTFYPYYQLGYMLTDQKQFKEALPFLEKAIQLAPKRDILHQLGYCYFQLQEYEKAKDMFSKALAVSDIENRSLFNLALTEFECKNFDKVKSIAMELSKVIETNEQSIIGGYDIAQIYFLLNDFEKSTEYLLKQGIDGIELYDWKGLSYSLYKTNKALWSKQLTKSIKVRTVWIEEIECNHEDWDEYSTLEKQERLEEIRIEIQVRENALKNGMLPPKQNNRATIIDTYSGCLLFDCKRHGNMKDDIQY